MNRTIGLAAALILSVGAASAALILSADAASAAQAPRVTSLASLSALATPLPYPYDANENADAKVDAALAEAKRTHKRAFIDLGGNWCGDCRVLAGLMLLPEYTQFIAAHYVVVTVDVGRFDRNLQIPARWGVDVHREGAPAVLIVDPQTNRMVNTGHAGALEDARHMTPQSILDWIAQWAD